MNENPAQSVLDVLDSVTAHWETVNYEVIDELIMSCPSCGSPCTASPCPVCQFDEFADDHRETQP